MDTKRYARFLRPGHALTGVRDKTAAEKRERWGYEYAHSIVDDHSRLAYSELHPDQRAATVTAFVTRALVWYQALGIQPRRIMTDNAWAYTKNPSLRRLLQRHDIRHILMRPHTPRTNGKIERFHQTISREWAYGVTYTDHHARDQALPHWLDHYNQQPPHSSLGGRPPISRVHNLCGQDTYTPALALSTAISQPGSEGSKPCSIVQGGALGRLGPVDHAGDLVAVDKHVGDLQVAVREHGPPRPERSVGDPAVALDQVDGQDTGRYEATRTPRRGARRSRRGADRAMAGAARRAAPVRRRPLRPTPRTTPATARRGGPAPCPEGRRARARAASARGRPESGRGPRPSPRLPGRCAPGRRRSSGRRRRRAGSRARYGRR